MRPRQVFRQKAAAQPTQLRIELFGHAGHGENVQPAQQPAGHAAALPDRIGDHHGPVQQQFCIRHGLSGLRQRVMGRNGIDEVNRAQWPTLHRQVGRRFYGHANGQVGLSRG